MAQSEAEQEALNARTIDFVATGEQQSEAGHNVRYSDGSTTDEYNGERYRDAKAGGFIEYTLYNNSGIEENLSIMLRFITADTGRKGTLTVDGEQLADITIPDRVKGSDDRGFYNVEYPIPASLAKGKKQFVVRLTASPSTLCPGLYYVRLLKNYDNHAYHFRCTDWTTGDENRVAASNLNYDIDRNIIQVTGASGRNNVCLSLKHENLDYRIDKEQKYLVVRGDNLRTTSGSSYLWWLNGSNHGTEVEPTETTSVTVDGVQQQVIAWDMTASGLYENFADERPSVCEGATIFGLTAKTGSSANIYDVNFAANVADYISMTTAVGQMRVDVEGRHPVYDLGGRPVGYPARAKGLYVSQGKKIIL